MLGQENNLGTSGIKDSNIPLNIFPEFLTLYPVARYHMVAEARLLVVICLQKILILFSLAFVNLVPLIHYD